MAAEPDPSGSLPALFGRGRWRGPLFAAFIACVWLNQSVGLITWEKIRYGVFTDPSAHLVDTLRYPLIFLYRRSADEAMYYGTAAQILGQPYDHAIFETHSRGSVPGLVTYEIPPPPTDGRWHVPWAEVHLEYPPPAVPFILGPKLVTTEFDAYGRLFGLLMGLCMVASIALAIDVLRRTRPPDAVLSRRWWLGSLLLVAAGALTIQRLDPTVALAMMVAVHGAVRRRPWELGLGCALAAASKIVPALLLPAIVVADWSYWRSRLGALAAWFAAGAIAGFGPMFLASPTAVMDFIRYHGARGLQDESTLGILVESIRWVTGTTRPSNFAYGSFNVDGTIADLLAKTTLPLTVAAIALLVAREWRAGAPKDETSRIDRIARAAVAATVILWLGGKVFSPQYLTWGIPLVLAIPGRRGLQACGLAIVAFTLTQIYHRGYYSFVIDQRFLGLFTVLVRQVVLALLLVVVVRSDAVERAPRTSLASHGSRG